jgi:hypothetical protein
LDATNCSGPSKVVGIDAIVEMRISSTLLKPAACLLVGASAVFGCTAANAAMIVNAYNSGTDTVIDFSGTIDTSGFTFLRTNLNSSLFRAGGASSNAAFLNNPSLTAPIYIFTPASAVTDVGISDTIYSATSSIGDSFGFNLSLNYIFLASDYGSGNPLAGSQTYSQSLGTLGLAAGNSYNLTAGNNTITFNVSTSNPAAVPAPLPLLGLPAVLFYTRKLKKRIKASREISSSSLV